MASAEIEIIANKKDSDDAPGPFTTQCGRELEGLLMARDAVQGMTASYYVDESAFDERTGLYKCQSVWGNDPTRLAIASLVKRPAARLLFKVLAYLLLVTALFEKPRIWSQIPYWVGWVPTGIVLVIFWIVFAVKMYCIMPQTDYWFQGAQEEVWTILLGVSLLCSTIGLILQASGGDDTDIYTIHGDITFSRVDLWLRVVRAYYLVYFSPVMRSGIISTFKIFYELRATFGLIMVSFLCHYFAYQAAMDSEDKDSNGQTQWQRNLGNPSGDAKDGLWNLFILLTTANHPDIVMSFYNEDPVSILLLLSFMCITMYFFMNLLLGVVYSAYQACYSDELLANKRLKSAILNSAFDHLSVVQKDEQGVVVDEGVDYPGFIRMVCFIREQNTQEFDGTAHDVTTPESLGDFVSKVHQVLGSIDRHKAPQSRVWFDMLDSDGSGTIEAEEFQKIGMVMKAPLQRIDHQAPALKDAGPLFTTMNKIFVSGSLADIRPDQINEEHPTSICFMISWTFVFDVIIIGHLVLVTFAKEDDHCDEAWTVSLEILITLFYLIDIVGRLFGEATAPQKLRFLTDTKSMKALVNWIDLAVLVAMLINLGLCEPDEDSQVLRLIIAIVRCCRLSTTVPQLSRIVALAHKVLGLVVPQLTVFVMVYFGFATAGMALFAGDTTRTLATGGPGDWTTTPWSGTSYGGTSFYTNLNFDNLGRAFFLLFTLMVQNNWSVTADGYEQTNDRWTRIYFLIFNIMVVMVMCNIFVASVMQYYSDLDGDDGGLAQEKLQNVMDMLTATEFSVADHPDKSCWYVKLEIEDDSSLIADEDDEANTEKVEHKQYSKNELGQNRSLLNDLPIAVCIQELNGTYTWANKHYKEIVISDAVLEHEKMRSRAVNKAKNVESKPDITLTNQTDAAFLDRDDLGELRVRKIRELLEQQERDLNRGRLDPPETQHSEFHRITEDNPFGVKYTAIMRPIKLLKEHPDGTQMDGVMLFLLNAGKSQRSLALDFISLDKDKNNSIDITEWVARFGDTEESRAAFNKYDLDGDRLISREEFIARDKARTLHALQGSTGSRKHRTGPSEQAATQMLMIDRSKKGHMKGKGSQLDQADTNRDGKIDRDEWQARYKTLGGFDQYDLNGDNVIDKDEADLLLLSVFEAHDKNGSGTIDSKELLTIFMQFAVDPDSLNVAGELSAIELTDQIISDYGSSPPHLNLDVEVDSNGEPKSDSDGNPIYRKVMDFEQFKLMVDENDFWPEMGILMGDKREGEVPSTNKEATSTSMVRQQMIDLFDDFDMDGDNEIDSSEFYSLIQNKSNIKISVMPDGVELVEELVDLYGISHPGYLHFNEFARALVQTSAAVHTRAFANPHDPEEPLLVEPSKSLASAFNINFPSDCDIDLIWKMPRYKPGTRKNKFNHLNWYRRMQASMYVRDATHMMTGTYYIRNKYSVYDEISDHTFQEEGVSTVWADDPASLEWMQLLRSPDYRGIFKVLSYLCLFATCLERPNMWSEIPPGIGSAIAISCLLVFWYVAWIYLKCMWPCRARWWRGSSEEYWLIGMWIALVLATLGVIFDIAELDHERIETIFGTVEIDRTAMVLKTSRAYFVLFFSPTMRSGFLSSFEIFTRIGSVVGLIVLFFMIHFFTFRAVMSDEQWKANIGTPDGFQPDALWNFFVTLTTANHPDIVMDLYNSNQWSCLILVSFMVFTFYFLMSLLLGVVCSAYNDIYGQACTDDQHMEDLMLLEAFEMSKSRNPKQKLQDQISTLRDEAACLRLAGDSALTPMLDKNGLPLTKGAGGEVVMTVRHAVFISNLPERVGPKLFYQKFDLAQVEIAEYHSGEGDYDIFIPKNSLNRAYGFAIVYLTSAPDDLVIKRLQAQMPDHNIKGMRMMVPDIEKKIWQLTCELKDEEWGMNFETFSEIVSLYGDGKGEDEELIQVWFDMMDSDGTGYIDYSEFKAIKQILNAPLQRKDVLEERRTDTPLCPTMHSFAITARLGKPDSCLHMVGWESFVDTVTLISVVWTVFVPDDDVCDTYGFTFEMLWTVIFVTDVIVTPLGMAKTANKWAYFEAWYHFLDILAAIGMVVSVSLCAGDSSTKLRKVVGLVRVLRTFRLTYALDALRTIVRCALKVLILIVPQLTMFIVVYYSFALIGMACFAGDVTRTVATGGPGDWSSAPWSTTSFGSTAYYYRLNLSLIHI
eukprot:TRINITY_DN19136_c0_g1_i1.p1 TRINITY_DN19136_c0_g1~~TRINITY_DN19136_c0_g1_i1.p1  ORF type:complete len:2180 (-),score=510.78 TRINITY_DN19136_c0_g1_i1:180-6719(-)